MVYMVKDIMRDSYTSITRLPEKSNEYGLMHVMAVKIVKIKNKAILFLLISKTQYTYFSVFVFLLSVVCFGTYLLLKVNNKVKRVV